MNAIKNLTENPSGFGRTIPAAEGFENALLAILRESLEKKCVDALLVPMKAPGTKAFAWVLMKDPCLLADARPLPPVLTVQGGHVLSNIAKHGKADHTIAALLRPCELRATVELSKLKQIDLEHIVLISVDCPGAVPLTKYMTSPQPYEESFGNILATWEDSEDLRPVCRVCNRFSLEMGISDKIENETGEDTVTADIHIGLLGENSRAIHLIPATGKGRRFMEQLGHESQDSLDGWKQAVKERAQDKLKKREKFNSQWQEDLDGADKLSSAFDDCINCHNCMRVCPICYCQQCYFDSPVLQLGPEEYIQRAGERGALRFPLDTIQFHLGRMSHMVLSCVSCGACEDACPMNVPVAQIFTMVGDRTQKEFEYIPGRSRTEALPLQSFCREEFCEVETPSECSDKSRGKAN
jgi:formate dehydrogenase (coenzyme F420) beta subunit